MKKLLTAAVATIALTFAFSGSALAAKPSITATPDTVNFGEVVLVTGEGLKSPWAIAECFANDTTVGGNGVVYASYIYIIPHTGYPLNDEFVNLGPTPSWQSGGADCVVTALKLTNDGAPGARTNITTTFTVLP